MIIRHILAATALFAAINGVTPANASLTKLVTADGDVYQTKVSYADLNLGSVEGRAALKRRITHASFAVCANHSADLVHACRNFAMKSAATQYASVIGSANGTQVAYNAR